MIDKYRERERENADASCHVGAHGEGARARRVRPLSTVCILAPGSLGKDRINMN